MLEQNAAILTTFATLHLQEVPVIRVFVTPFPRIYVAKYVDELYVKSPHISKNRICGRRISQQKNVPISHTSASSQSSARWKRQRGNNLIPRLVHRSDVHSPGKTLLIFAACDPEFT